MKAMAVFSDEVPMEETPQGSHISHVTILSGRKRSDKFVGSLDGDGCNLGHKYSTQINNLTN
ncbi:hypothetical protein Avbf_12334 [Armadillidium vulgare]|nr:hypothetical protein Avbf_12334 [Armadillidium vulgare]